MNFNYKLFFKYILFHTNQIFLKYLYRNNKNINVYITENNFYYLCLHFKLSSLFYSIQLMDIFAYELPINNNNKINNKNKFPITNNSLLTYNFHLIFFQQRFFIFVINLPKKNFAKYKQNWNSLNSITELFLNANWLEREIAELHGIFFSNKKDLRNLMLPYGDSSAPMRKSFPSVGLREIFYDSSADLLIQNPVTIQF